MAPLLSAPLDPLAHSDSVPASFRVMQPTLAIGLRFEVLICDPVKPTNQYCQ